MIEFSIRVAGRVAAVTAMHESTREYCEAYLCTDAPDFCVHIAPEDILYERGKSAQEDQAEGRTPRYFTDAEHEITAVQRKIAEWLITDDTLLFHGSVVAVDGAAYLFTAKSGTGKSTHTRLWRDVFGSRAIMIDDDKPFLRIGDEGVLAYGTPWNGKHRIGNNVSVPLRAVCILERSEQNHISRISAQEALPMLLQQSQRPMNRQYLPQYLTLLDALAGRVAFYRLRCNMDREAAVIAYEAMADTRKDVVK